MVTLDQFKDISFDQKCDIVTLHSNYLTMRSIKNCKIYLYHSGEYFIEVHYSTLLKRVLSIYAFEDSTGLEPYADAISLADLKLYADRGSSNSSASSTE